MNIKERNGVINQQSDIFRISGRIAANQSTDPTKYWNLLSRPPIRSYIPDWVIQRLWDYARSPRLANNPVKKFELTNELLKPFGFKELASGTNRRTFYYDYDPNIVLKIGSDDVGIKDNKSEFEYTQHILKPFCPKVFWIDGDGVVSLMERGEPMTEHEYKKVYYKDIFEIFMILLQRGYVMEDAGSNYYKNFGIRMGFGPIIWDFPYVCKVDYHKLKCCHPDPITHEICGGEIDYNYNKGMNELICTKCGVRYSAKYLEDKDPVHAITPIETERGRIMGMINTNFKVNIKRGNTIVDRLYAEETKVQEPITKKETIVTSHNRIVEEAKATGIVLPPQVENDAVKMYDNIQRPEVPKKEPIINTVPPKKEVVADEPYEPALQIDANGRKRIQISKEKFMEIVKSGKKDSTPIKTVGAVKEFEHFFKNGKRYCSYPSLIKNHIMQWLSSMEEKFGASTAILLADKIEVEYLPREEWLKKKEVAQFNHVNKMEAQAKEKAEREAAAKETLKKADSVAPIVEPKIIHKEDIIKQHMDNPTISTLARKDPVDIIIPPPSNKSVSPEKWMSRTPIEGSVETETKEDVPIKEAEFQKTGLFPMRPKTPEEIEAEEAKKNNESAVLGFPGVPVVETIRFKQEIPKVKSMVTARFDKFRLDIKDTESQIKKMEKDVKEWCQEEVAEIMGTGTEGIEVSIQRTADHKNADCFKISVTNNQSPVFSTIIYPDNKGVDEMIEKDISTEEVANEVPTEITDEFRKEILDYLNESVKDFDASQCKTVEDVSSSVHAFLYCRLRDRYKDKINVALMFNILAEYVNDHITINPNTEKEDSKEETVESQL